MHIRRSILLSSALLVFGCGDDKARSGEGGEGGDGSGEAGTAASEGGSEEGDSGNEEVFVPARGISISKVTVNQGVSVPIAVGGTWADGSLRNARIVPNRDTLVRVHHTLEEGWVPRELVARLTLELPNGEQRIYDERMTIELDSGEKFLDRGFFWGLVADEGETQNGVKFQVELFDIEGNGGEAFSEAVRVTPPQPELVGFEMTDMDMKLVYVPFTYNGNTPDISGDTRTAVERETFQMNPLTTLTTDVRAPVPYNQTLTDLGNLLPVLDQLHNQDGVAGNVYYAGMINTGASSGVLGIAPLGGIVNANIFQANRLKTTSITTTHEIGHNQGLQHIACPGGGAAGPDPSYPYENGTVGGVGFGIRDFTIYPDSAFNYMSYCFQVMWVSDWTWEKVWTRIQQFTAAGDEVPMVPVVRSQLNPDGSEVWWESSAAIDLETLSGNYEVEFVRDGEVVETRLGMVTPVGEDRVWVTAEMPDQAYDTIRRVSDELTVEVERDALDAYAVRNDLR